MKKFFLLFCVLAVIACKSDDDNETIDECLAVTNIQASSITPTSATIAWTDANNAASYLIEYGESGFSIGNGIAVSSTTTSFNLSGLVPETSYDVYVQASCSSNNTSDLSSIFTFTSSEEECIEVTDILVSDIDTSSAIISWTDPNEADSYIIEYGFSGFTMGSGTIVTATSASINLSGLQPETSYDFYVQVQCSSTNLSDFSSVSTFTTEAPDVVAEFLPNLSELNLFSGNLSDLNITSKAFKYELSTELFTDYAHKLRFIALPEGTSLEFDGDGLPVFPDNTVIAKTFYYNNNETDLSQGRTIIETRVLIKIDSDWETGDYVWNAAQTDATLDLNASVVPITWIDSDGESNSINYEIPSNENCFTCHASFGRNAPIGPKLRSMNFEIDGVNQIDQFIANSYLTGITSSTSVGSLPNWQDTSLSLEERTRAYIDMQCAHCHIPGGDCYGESTLNLAYETSLEESLIDEQSPSIELRVTSTLDGIRMPLIGTTIQHDDGIQLILDYLNSLE